MAREYMVVAARARRGIVVGHNVQGLSGSEFVKCPQLTTSFLFPITLCPSPNATHFLLWAPARGTCGPCVVVRGSRHRCAQAARLVTCSRSPEEPCAWRHRSDCRVHRHFSTTRPAALRRRRRHCLWQRRNASARWHGAREWRGRAHPAPRAAPHAHSDAARAHTAVDAASSAACTQRRGARAHGRGRGRHTASPRPAAPGAHALSARGRRTASPRPERMPLSGRGVPPPVRRARPLTAG